jgi:hypothetical protein
MLLIGEVISRRNRLPFTFVVITTLILAACGDGDSNSEAPTPQASDTTGRVLGTEEPARLYAADPGDQAGAIASGDFNGDDQADVALAAAFADGPDNGRPDAGEVYIFLGPIRAGDVRDAAAGEQALTIFGAAAGDQAGRALASGDFNADGLTDVAVSSPFADGPANDRPDSGEVNIVFGSAQLGVGPSSVDLANSSAGILGATAGDLAGISVSASNLNGDDASDLLIGAFFASGPGDSRQAAGEVYAFMGGSDLNPSRDLAVDAPDVIVYGALTEDRLGEDVGAGDVNGDGIEEMILAAPFARSSMDVPEAGQTYVLQSPPAPVIDLSSTAPLATVFGVDDGDQLGHFVVSGDFDGEGRSDVLLTAVSADGPENAVDLAGEAVVFVAEQLNQDLAGVPGEARALIYGEAAQYRLGRSAGAADVDGDGTDEMLLGAPGASDGGFASGRMYLLRMDDLGEEVVLPYGSLVLDGEEEGDSFTSEVYGKDPLEGADMDGDDREEVLVVAPLGDGPGNTRNDCGEALILFITDGSA